MSYIHQDKCQHQNNITEHGITVCIDCGEEVSIKLNCEKDTREYGQIETIENDNIVKPISRKVEEKGIYTDMDKLGITNDAVLTEVNKLYLLVTNGQIYRGCSRKSIILGCIMFVYRKRQLGNADRFIDILGITRKVALRGIKTVTLNAPKEQTEDVDLTPSIIMRIMEKFQTTQAQKTEVLALHNSVKNRSSKLNRARPHSVASGLIYYWIQKNNKGISLSDFSKQVCLSGLTIMKVMNEIQLLFPKESDL